MDIGRSLLVFLSLSRKSALEGALSEKQDFLSHLADCLTWLGQAEKHLRVQKPLGSDLAAVTVQYDTHQVSEGSTVDAKCVLVRLTTFTYQCHSHTLC